MRKPTNFNPAFRLFTLLLAGFILGWGIACTSGNQEKNTDKQKTSKNREEETYEEVRTQPQLDDGFNFNIQVDHPDWLKNATIYEVNVRQYTEEGTFNAFSEHLPRLKKLGVEVLWLMPIHPIGEKNRKGELGSYYSVKNYFEVNPEFGTMEDFKKLVNQIHNHGMHVIIGWIANHTAWDNPLTKEHPDWYVRDKSGNMMPPPGTDWTDVAMLDVKNKEVQDYMINGMAHWVKETNIDGYRCDVAGWAPTGFWNRARERLEQIKPVFLLAEAEKPILHEKAFDVSYAWHFSKIINEVGKGKREVSAIKEYFVKYVDDFPKNGMRMYFTTNHDLNSWEGTVYDRFGQAANTFFTLVATIPGMPLIYSGQEIGLDRQLPFFEHEPINWEQGKILTPFFRSLVTLKRNNRALWNGKFGGDMQIINTPSDKPVFAYYREKEGDKVLTVLNFGGEELSLKLRGNKFAGEYREIFSDKTKTFTGNDSVTLRPYGYKVYAITGQKSESKVREL